MRSRLPAACCSKSGWTVRIDLQQHVRCEMFIAQTKVTETCSFRSEMFYAPKKELTYQCRPLAINISLLPGFLKEYQL